MAICEFCGKEFDIEEAADDFNCEFTYLTYGNFTKCLCFDCASTAIREQQEDVYYERCENCGRTFDLIEDEVSFSNHFDWSSGTRLQDHWKNGVLCADCAIDEIEENM